MGSKLFKRFRIRLALRILYYTEKDATKKEALKKALRSNDIVDELDTYLTDLYYESGDSEERLIIQLLRFIVEHREEILEIILALLPLFVDDES